MDRSHIILIGLERTWNRLLSKAELKALKQRWNKATDCKSHMPAVSSLWERKIPLQTVIADYLDRMQIASSHSPRCHGGASSESTIAVLHLILDYPEMKSEKDGAWEYSEDQCPQIVTFQEVTEELPRSQGLNPKMS